MHTDAEYISLCLVIGAASRRGGRLGTGRVGAGKVGAGAGSGAATSAGTPGSAHGAERSSTSTAPHIFHTANRRVFDYLSRFTGWRDYQAPGGRPMRHGTTEMPVPFNDQPGAGLWRERPPRWRKSSSPPGWRGEEGHPFKVAPQRRCWRPGDLRHENVFLHYTMKQLGPAPQEIDPNTTALCPVFLFRDYWSRTPGRACPGGVHPPSTHRVTVELGVDARERLTWVMAWPWTACPLPGLVIQTRAVDELFARPVWAASLPDAGVPLRDYPVEFLESHETHTPSEEWHASRSSVAHGGG